MGRSLRRTILAVFLAAAAAGCDPYSDPAGSSAPDADSEQWRGAYTGLSLLTCPEVGAYEREMQTTLRLMPALEELNIQLFLVPDLAYSPKFRFTGPVANDRRISFHIEDEIFIYHAELTRTDDHVSGALWICDLDDRPHWQVICIEVDR